MNKYLHLGTLVAALNVGCAANSAVVEPAKPAEAAKETAVSVCDKVDLKEGNYITGGTLQVYVNLKGDAYVTGEMLRDNYGVYTVMGDGSYCDRIGGTHGMPVGYQTVAGDGARHCSLWLKKLDKLYLDLNCDDRLDYVSERGMPVLNREEFAKKADVGYFDQTLGFGRMFVCKENRVNYDDKQ